MARLSHLTWNLTRRSHGEGSEQIQSLSVSDSMGSARPRTGGKVSESPLRAVVSGLMKLAK